MKKLIQKPESRRLIKRIMNVFSAIVLKVIWILIFLLLFLLFGYITLVLLWCLLGVIINPAAFLPYGVASGTLFTTLSRKYKK